MFLFLDRSVLSLKKYKILGKILKQNYLKGTVLKRQWGQAIFLR